MVGTKGNGYNKPLKAKDGGLKRRVGHRGWLVDRVINEGVLVITPNKWSKQAFIKDYPQKMIWPNIDDFHGSFAFIDAVMDKNLSELKNLMKKYPEYDFGMDGYVETLEKKHKYITSIHRRVLKRVTKNGVDMEVSLIFDKNDINVVVSVTRGNRLLASDILYTIPNPTPA